MTGRSHFQLQVASATHPGAIRSCNEDSLATDSDLGLVVLADGMGGYKAGDVASSIATGLIMDYLRAQIEQMGPSAGRFSGLSPEAWAIQSTLEKTNLAIYNTAKSDTKFASMGTTIVLILFHQSLATIAHVGDSRAYRLRDGRLSLLTHDHSLLQQQVEMGLITTEHARVSHNRNLVSRALGADPAIRIEITEHHVQPDDIFLLCSDGLNDMVDDADIELAVRELRANPILTVNQLVQMANDNGGHDNISVILAKVMHKPAGIAALWDRARLWLKNTLG